MTSRLLPRWTVLVIALMLMIGCGGGAPVLDIQDASITPVSGEEPTLDEVTRAIVSAATGSTPIWNMQVVEPGHIVATLHNRRHMASVDINYTTKGYSITRKETSNLKYDAEKGTIHPGYNKWIRRLDNNIRVKLAML